MSIEQAIKQKRPFRNARQRAAVNLIYTHNWLQESMRDLLTPFDLTQKQYNVLRILRGAGEPLTTSVIRERLLDKMSDTSRIVDRLHQKGWVEKRICLSDKRLVDVSLSREGSALLERHEELNPAIDGLLSRLTVEEAEQLSELLDKIRG